MDGRQILPDMWNWAGSGDSAAEVVHAVDFSQRVQLVVAFSGPPAEAYLCISFLERFGMPTPNMWGLDVTPRRHVVADAKNPRSGQHLATWQLFFMIMKDCSSQVRHKGMR